MDVITDLPPRKGERPTTTSTFPHTQLDQQPVDPSVVASLAARAFALDGVVERPTCISVPGARALALDEGCRPGPDLAFMCEREFAHFHPGPDWSLHATLPDATADLAIERGWAELHLVARTEQFPGSVVMLYAPRDEAEAEVVWALVQASSEYAGAGTAS